LGGEKELVEIMKSTFGVGHLPRFWTVIKIELNKEWHRQKNDFFWAILFVLEGKI
jgi:hypothetical protein